MQPQRYSLESKVTHWKRMTPPAPPPTSREPHLEVAFLAPGTVGGERLLCYVVTHCARGPSDPKVRSPASGPAERSRLYPSAWCPLDRFLQLPLSWLPCLYLNTPTSVPAGSMASGIPWIHICCAVQAFQAHTKHLQPMMPPSANTHRGVLNGDSNPLESSRPQAR